jgi:hypothetical protein
LGLTCYTEKVTDEQEVSDQMLAGMLQDAARRVQDGEAARQERLGLIDEANRRDWPQEKTAHLAGVTQQAVSKRSKKIRDDPADTTE